MEALFAVFVLLVIIGIVFGGKGCFGSLLRGCSIISILFLLLIILIIILGVISKR